MFFRSSRGCCFLLNSRILSSAAQAFLDHVKVTSTRCLHSRLAITPATSKSSATETTFTVNTNLQHEHAYVQSLLSLENDGFISFPSRVPPELIQPCLKVVSETFISQKESFDLQLLRLTNNVYSSKNRYSIPLPWSKEIGAVLTHIRSNSSVGSVLEEIAGADGELVELSVIISLPGSSAQDNHSDLSYVEGTVSSPPATRSFSNTINENKLTTTDLKTYPLLCSVFVALQNIEDDMGATKIYPKTHTKDFHSRIKSNSYTYSPDGFLELDQELALTGSSNHGAIGNFDGYDEGKFVSMTVKEGSVYAIDSRVIHAGGANTSTKPRYLLCFAFQRRDSSGGGRAVKANGFTYHLHPSVEGLNLTLKHFIQ